MDDTCAFHPSALAQVRCAGCGRLLCWECARPVRGRYFCAACAGAVAKRGRENATLRPLVVGLAALFLVIILVAFLTPPPRPASPSNRALTPGAAPSPPTRATTVPVVAATAAATPIPVTPTAAASPTLVPSPATATTAPPTPTREASPTASSLEEAAALVKRYTVLVVTDRGSGSGISLGDGTVLTAYHVVKDAKQVAVRFAGGRGTMATVARGDATHDLALLTSPQLGEPGAGFRDARTLRPAETLLVVGYPRADAIGIQESTVTRGIFSARWRSPAGVWYVQTDAPVNPGNSGGPLADGQGRVVGIVTVSIRGAVGINYAVASDEAAAFLGRQL